MDRELFLLAALVDRPLTVHQIYQYLVPLAGDSGTTVQEALIHMRQRTAALPYCCEEEIRADLAHLAMKEMVVGEKTAEGATWTITDTGKARLIWHGSAARFIGNAACFAQEQSRRAEVRGV